MKKSAILFLTFLTFSIGILSVKAIYNYETKEVIYIDPGHGGFDGGASSLNKRIVEKDVVLKVSWKLKHYLESYGYRVLLTRDLDEALAPDKRQDMQKRVKLINSSKCSLYISIHANSYSSQQVFGAQTFYNTKSSDNQFLATEIMEMLKIIDPYNNRIAKPITGKYLTDQAKQIGCLVEIGFLSNPNEAYKLNDNTYQEKIAYAICLGIIKYKGQDYEKQ